AKHIGAAVPLHSAPSTVPTKWETAQAHWITTPAGSKIPSSCGNPSQSSSVASASQAGMNWSAQSSRSTGSLVFTDLAQAGRTSAKPSDYPVESDVEVEAVEDAVDVGGPGIVDPECSRVVDPEDVVAALEPSPEPSLVLSAPHAERHVNTAAASRVRNW